MLDDKRHWQYPSMFMLSLLFASISDVEQHFRVPKNGTIVRHRRTGTRIAYINTGMTSDVSNSVY
jgi:hypothetical protein